MKNTVVKLTLVGAALTLWSAIGHAQTTATPAGHWQGKVQIPDRETPITIDLALNPKGQWIGSVTVPGTTLADVPLSDITVDGAAVRFAARLPDRATFAARLSADANSLNGTASNA